MINLEEIENIIKNATPGPWYVIDDDGLMIATTTKEQLEYRKTRSEIEREIEEDNDIELKEYTFPGIKDSEIIIESPTLLEYKVGDLELMARSRMLLPLLLNEVKRLASENVFLREKVREMDKENASLVSVFAGSPNIL